MQKNKKESLKKEKATLETQHSRLSFSGCQASENP